eukprot:g35783.t1
MGTCMGLSYACLCVGFIEQSLFYNHTIRYLFLRYTDDCISAALCSCKELKQFINFANIFHPALIFTWTISDTSLPFLGLSVSRLTTDHCTLKVAMQVDRVVKKAYGML